MQSVVSRRSLVATGIGLIGAAGWPLTSLRAEEPPHDVTFAEDFEELWRTLG